MFYLVALGGLLTVLNRSKYPLAVLHRFMSADKKQRETNGEVEPPKGDLVVAYDIACSNSKTIRRSPLASLAKWERYTAALMMMHGWGHDRACQIAFLLLYVPGAGLEDAETCERYFSKSNALASVTRHASIFHRRQAIAQYAYHTDHFETYGNLSKFIYNNYKQALKTLDKQDALVGRMKQAGLTTPKVFEEWMKEEAEYLQSLSKEPPKETLTMEYYQKLVELEEVSAVVKDALDEWVGYVPNSREDKTLALERARRHSRESQRKLVQEVQALENKLQIRIRWVRGCSEWKAAEDLVASARYRRALDKLESLLVRRMFEMGRLNVAGTGEWQSFLFLCLALQRIRL